TEKDTIKISYIKGYPDGTFRPQGNLTRAEAAVMMARLLNQGDVTTGSRTTKFTDANNGWYSQGINYVVEKGLIQGYEDGTFKPNQDITRAEFAKMIAEYVEGNQKGKSNLKDIEKHWAKEAIEKVYGKEIVKGYPDGTFKPNQKITRAEAVTILNRAFGRYTNNNSIKDVNITKGHTFSDVKPSDWFYYEVFEAANTHSVTKSGHWEKIF
ncbi:MAG: S-layer homology domain-containing protein, partial [Tissierellia bacterium]|nr:S-layer homology domain-containing protein [Tissierellia bacterium]